MHWACLLLPQLALDGVLRRHPAPHEPLALVTGPAQRRVLHAVNPAAKALGLRAGMGWAAAQALCTGFATVEHDPEATEHLRQLLAAWAYGFSSQVSTDLPHAIVLEVGGSLNLFGPWSRFEARLREELRALGIRHRISVAPNPQAARVLANAGDGLALDEDDLVAGLGRIPVERAGLDPAVATAFSRMGLRQLRQVFVLPRDGLARRFPKDLLPWLDTLRGLREAPLHHYRPPDRFDARIELEQEVESSQALLFPLRRLTADLAAFLAGRDGGVQRFVLRLEHDRRADSEVVIGLLAPEREATVLFELARGRLEQARVPAPVRGLRLLARELPPFVPARRDLFDARPQQAVPWLQLRERLRARLGDGAVHGLAVQADHRPERAWHRLDNDGPASRKTSAFPRPPNHARPGWLLPLPQPLPDDGLRLLAGPERIESGWWDDGEARRDYYLVETAQGQHAWAWCPAGAHGPWTLHGWFA
ncbi:Y-family DNA polymerase [Lysobacter olei]